MTCFASLKFDIYLVYEIAYTMDFVYGNMDIFNFRNCWNFLKNSLVFLFIWLSSICLIILNLAYLSSHPIFVDHIWEFEQWPDKKYAPIGTQEIVDWAVLGFKVPCLKIWWNLKFNKLELTYFSPMNVINYKTCWYTIL